MGEAELDPTVVKKTQETLGQFVKKPPLTEKLLKKPPFRFLHDVFKAVIKDTGYFDGLYNADEMNIENIKDRDDKMRFLQKMIDVVKLTTEKDLNVRTSKIVAGHEAERTNELLQLMGEIIEKKMDWKKAVETVAMTMVTSSAVAVVNAAEVLVNDTTTKKDVKTKEKSKDKGNSKTAAATASKEIKTKEGQSKKSTPSPEDKIVKRTIKAAPATTTLTTTGKAKEKASLSRQATIEKTKTTTTTTSKEKDKEKMVVKKSKESKDGKTKGESKRATPSPVKPPATKLTQSKENENVKHTTKNENESMNKKMENKENENQTNESLTTKQQSIEVSNELQKADNLENEIKTPTNGQSINEQEYENQKVNENLAIRKRSSKSRRSSASKQQNVEAERTPNMETEKVVNEVEVKNLPSTEFQKEAELKQSSPSLPPPAKPIAKEIKREPTFTHENSRDSVGSNSNSSTTRPRTSLRPPSARPPSARPGAPRRRDRNVEIILQPNDQVKMSNNNVKLENFGVLDDDGENLVIIEDATSGADKLLQESNDTSKEAAEKLEQQGHLVQQILETQKVLVQQNGLKSEKETIEPIFDANARQSSARQMNNLRDIIQSLTKSVNPFGKLMDFIPEDIDAMQLELNMWRDNYTQAASDLKREKSLTESATEPMKNELIQIDANIKEYLEMIDASRVKILQNSAKISKMLLEQ